MGYRDIEVYPSEFFVYGFNKPKPGYFLNKPALVKFKGFFKGGSKKMSERVRKGIEKVCKERRAEFVEFDEKCNVLVLKVNYF